MKFGPVPLAEAEGNILGHNLGDGQGKAALRKGQRLSPEDLSLLKKMGKEIVYVAQLDDSDLDENEAARRVALASQGAGTVLSGPANGRVNVRAEWLGVLRVDPSRLAHLNDSDGVTLATLSADRLVHPRRIVATVKVIPYALPETTIRVIEKDAADQGPLVYVDAVEQRSVGLILSGPEAARERLLAQFSPLIERVEALGSTLLQTEIVPDDEDIAQESLAEALGRQHSAGVDLILLAGQTAVMDRRDIAPRAIESVGGVVEVVGAPVDPGNLLMLAYLDEVPVLGAPGCARSRKTNVVDWVLPRLLAGERLAKRDIVAMGHGGLLEDVPERPMPRSKVE